MAKPKRTYQDFDDRLRGILAEQRSPKPTNNVSAAKNRLMQRAKRILK